MSTLVKNLEKLNRPIIFDGLKSRTCSPTDFDSVMEFYNKYLIITEVKEIGVDITLGQQITTTRIIDAWNSDKNKIGIIILTHHSSADSMVILANTTISKVYMNGKWIDLSKKNINYKHFLQLFSNKHNIKHLNFN